MPTARLSLLLLCLAPLFAACPTRYPKPANLPDAPGVVERIEAHQQKARTFKHKSRMDYRVGDERVKTTVLVMGQRGARLRFNALDPTGVVAADLACDGIAYQFIDFQKNCQRSGPCTGDAIARLLRVNLEPDDFLDLAVGTTPLISKTGSPVRWDEKTGHAIVDLVTPDKQRTQTIILDGREGHYDVLRSTVRDAAGNIDWRIENKDFRTIKTADGGTLRVPERTRFEQPAAKGDLRVRWEKQEINVELPAGAWELQPPAGLPTCP